MAEPAWKKDLDAKQAKLAARADTIKAQFADPLGADNFDYEMAKTNDREHQKLFAAVSTATAKIPRELRHIW